MNSLPLFVLDTHVLYWHVFETAKLSASARQAILDGETGKAILIVPYLILAELYYLLKKHNQANHFPGVIALLRSNSNYRFEAMVLEDVEMLALYPEISEMHDRLIVVLTNRVGATLITKDENIQASTRLNWIW